jgi:hypothetical protein
MTLSLAALASLPLPGLLAQDENVEVIVVSGRQPGPPLWRVTHGDNTLWILPLVSPIPRDMEWEDAQINTILAQSQEVISPPNVDVTASKLVLLNPINLVRGYRLVKRLSRNEAGGLRDVLPPEIYARYVAVKQRYFPKDDGLDALRPGFAANLMMSRVLAHEKLTNAGDIGDHIRKLARRQRQLQRIDTSVERKVEGGFGDLRTRAESWVESLSPEQELSCFTQQLDLIEHSLEDMKEVANAWATGNAYGLADLRRPDGGDGACDAMLKSSSEGEFMSDLELVGRQRWLEAVSAALETHHSTFTMLPLRELRGETSLAAALAAKGYVVHDPAEAAAR